MADVWTPDWLLAGVRGIGPICTRSAHALRDAVRLSREVSGGAPVLVVGHSAGGITGRLLTAPEPFPGRRFGAGALDRRDRHSGHSPPTRAGEGIGRRINEVAAAIADAAVPGAFFAPEIGYLSVASRAVRGDPAGSGRERVAHLLYRSVIGRAAVPGTEGDGLVPVVAASLDGARQLVLDDAIHGPGAGGPWYGSGRCRGRLVADRPGDVAVGPRAPGSRTRTARTVGRRRPPLPDGRIGSRAATHAGPSRPN